LLRKVKQNPRAVLVGLYNTCQREPVFLYLWFDHGGNLFEQLYFFLQAIDLKAQNAGREVRLTFNNGGVNTFQHPNTIGEITRKSRYTLAVNITPDIE
jgi:hypothetical protein